MTKRRGGTLAIGAIVVGVALAGCSASPAVAKPPVAHSQVVSSSGVLAACVPPGSTRTYPITSSTALRTAIFVHPSGGLAYQDAEGTITSYLQTAWPFGTESGDQSAASVGSWVDLLDPSSPVLNAAEAGPSSISSWTGGVPSAAQAAGVAFDARFLFYTGNPSGSLVASPWGSADLVGGGKVAAYPSSGQSISYGPNGQVTGMCLGWWVEVGRQAGTSFTWWYVHGVAAMVPVGSGWFMETPAASGWIYDQPGSPNAAPDWVSPTGFVAPAGEPSGAVAMPVGS